MSSERIEVRATVALAGVRVGTVVDVDPSEPFIRECLAAGLLVPTAPAVADRDKGE